MKFLIDDKAPELLDKPPTLRRVEAALANLEAGKLVTAPALANLTGIAHGTMMRTGHLVAEQFCVQRGNKKFYGNPKTIQAFKKHYGL
jgi:hypothetical protein